MDELKIKHIGESCDPLVKISMLQLKAWPVYGIEALKILLSWCISLPLLPFLALLYIYKLCVILCAKILHPELRPISALDTSFSVDKLAEEDDIKYEYERSPLNSIGVYGKTIEGKTDLNELTKRIQKQLIENKSDWNWKLKSYFVRFWGFGFWKEAPNFKVSNHVRKAGLKPGESVKDFLNAWIMKPYPPGSPLWEFMVLDAGDDEITALKVHHVMADGLSLFEILNCIFEVKNHPLVQKILDHPPLQGSMFDMIKLAVKTPSLLLTWITMLITAPDPFTLKPGRKVEQWLSTSSINLSDVKLISKKRGVGFQTVLLTIFAGGIRRFLLSRKNEKPIPKDLLIPVAQPWPGRPKNFIGNHWNAMFVFTPIHISDPLQRLDELQARISNYYESNMFLVVKNWICIRYTLSPFLAADSYTSYDGRTLKSVDGFASLVYPTIGMMTLTLSIKDQLIWTIMGDKDLFQTQQDLDLVTETYIVEEFEELLRAIVNRANS